MKLRTNNIMNSYLSQLEYDFLVKKVELPKELEEIVNADFLTDNDAIILKGLYKNQTNPLFNSDIEKCEWEYNETHFHPDGFIKRGDDEIEYMRFALECAKRLHERLDKNFKYKKFRLIVSFSETEKKGNEIETYGSSTVRFYQIRQGAEARMRSEDLNDFKQEAILEIET